MHNSLCKRNTTAQKNMFQLHTNIFWYKKDFSAQQFENAIFNVHERVKWIEIYVSNIP